MRLKSLVEMLAKRREGIWVLGSVAAILVGVQRLMHAPKERVVVPVPAAVPSPAIEQRVHFFTVKQTKSELGYTYWVLQGHGRYASFELFDTWSEAISAAEAHLAAARLSLALA